MAALVNQLLTYVPPSFLFLSDIKSSKRRNRRFPDSTEPHQNNPNFPQMFLWQKMFSFLETKHLHGKRLWTIPIPEVRGSNPIIGKILCWTCLLLKIRKEIEAWNGPFHSNWTTKCFYFALLIQDPCGNVSFLLDWDNGIRTLEPMNCRANALVTDPIQLPVGTA